MEKKINEKKTKEIETAKNKKKYGANGTNEEVRKTGKWKQRRNEKETK